jgi:hypothetical protein
MKVVLSERGRSDSTEFAVKTGILPQGTARIPELRNEQKIGQRVMDSVPGAQCPSAANFEMNLA